MARLSARPDKGHGGPRGNRVDVVRSFFTVSRHGSAAQVWATAGTPALRALRALHAPPPWPRPTSEHIKSGDPGEGWAQKARCAPSTALATAGARSRLAANSPSRHHATNSALPARVATLSAGIAAGHLPDRTPSAQCADSCGHLRVKP